MLSMKPARIAALSLRALALRALVVLGIFVGACSASDLKPFVFQAEPEKSGKVAQTPACAFPGLKLPADFAVFAAGAYSGRKLAFQIDQSGREGAQIDVAVNSPDKPVVLMLGAHNPTIWNIGWSTKTKILAVLVSGYHRQAVAGLEKNIPLVNSSNHNKGACGYFSISTDYDKLAQLNAKARQIFGRPVDMVFPAKQGRVVVGEPLRAETRLVTSGAITPESFYDKNAPLAGLAGLEDAVRKGLLRKATREDAEAWEEAIAQKLSQRDIPPVAGEKPTSGKPSMHNAYVVLKPFTYPAGLYGADLGNFFVPKGVPKPEGDPGHSEVYDFNTLTCRGTKCS